MSGKRIEIVEPCVHGSIDCGGTLCPGSSRRVLTEGQYVLIEANGDDWPAEWLRRLENLGLWERTSSKTSVEFMRADVDQILDALSEHTEGTPNG